jgi:hypothetical protein
MWLGPLSVCRAISQADHWFATNGFLRQHPPIETPAISLRFADPPSDVGTGGGQMGEEGPRAAAVVLAACVEVSGISPGNIRGD